VHAYERDAYERHICAPHDDPRPVFDGFEEHQMEKIHNVSYLG